MGGFFTDCDGGRHPPSRARNGTFTPRNSRGIWDLEFVHSHPPKTPALKAGACTNSGGDEVNPPGPGAVLGFG
eukprot:scaffold46984_cov24-Phaeocystis_antarctica.AAC.1